MQTSIAHVPRVKGGKSAPEAERDDLCGLLAAIRDALDVPPGPERPALLGDRVLLVLATVRDVLDGETALIPFETELLREKTAQQAGAGESDE